MYITVDTVKTLAELCGSAAVLGGVLIALYKFVVRDIHQNKVIKDILDEQMLIVYGLRGALQGLIEQGCDGPCKDALKKLDEHINQRAHTDAD
jgi:hypothetical protein